MSATKLPSKICESRGSYIGGRNISSANSSMFFCGERNVNYPVGTVEPTADQ